MAVTDAPTSCEVDFWELIAEHTHAINQCVPSAADPIAVTAGGGAAFNVKVMYHQY